MQNNLQFPLYCAKPFPPRELRKLTDGTVKSPPYAWWWRPMPYTFNPSTWEVDTGESLILRPPWSIEQDPGWPGLYRKTPSQKKKIVYHNPNTNGVSVQDPMMLSPLSSTYQSRATEQLLHLSRPYSCCEALEGRECLYILYY